MRAKFRCNSVTELFNTKYVKVPGVNGGIDEWKATDEKEKYAERVDLGAVYSTEPGNPNTEWAKYTPCGSLSMQIDNPGAWGILKQDKEYYLDLTEVTAA